MTNLVIFTLLGAALSTYLSYKLSAWFWDTNYSRTNHSGDFGGPSGGVFATIGGAFISFILLLKVGIHYIPADYFGYVLGAVCIPSFVAGVAAMFRPKKK